MKTDNEPETETPEDNTPEDKAEQKSPQVKGRRLATSVRAGHTNGTGGSTWSCRPSAVAVD